MSLSPEFSGTWGRRLHLLRRFAERCGDSTVPCGPWGITASSCLCLQLVSLWVSHSVSWAAGTLRCMVSFVLHYITIWFGFWSFSKPFIVDRICARDQIRHRFSGVDTSDVRMLSSSNPTRTDRIRRSRAVSRDVLERKFNETNQSIQCNVQFLLRFCNNVEV